MGWFHVALGVVTCFLLYSAGKWVAFWAAVIVLVGLFWTYGVMHNYATESAKRRLTFRGDFYDFTERDIGAVPDSIARLNLIFAVISLGFLVYGVYIKFWP